MKARSTPILRVGNTFGPAWVDYLLIGGGLSLMFTAALLLRGQGAPLIAIETLPYFLLLSNAAHFAASTVRLYSKPGTYEALPFLTMAFPLVALALLTLGMYQAARLGPHLQSLYLTWSPYHYAAQAYGLAVIYCFRSGCRLGERDKSLLRWVAMLPFLYNFTTAPDVGLSWLVPETWLAATQVAGLRAGLGVVLMAAAVGGPILLGIKLWRGASGPMPAIALMTVVANGVWFLVLGPLDAFVYATIFHGIQYMAIVIVFHVRDQKARPGNRHGSLVHALRFYGASLILGYALFNCLPLAYVFAGFGKVEAILLVVAAINLHHFIVDAFIWKLGRDESNRRVIDPGVPSGAALSAG